MITCSQLSACWRPAAVVSRWSNIFSRKILRPIPPLDASAFFRCDFTDPAGDACGCCLSAITPMYSGSVMERQSLTPVWFSLARCLDWVSKAHRLARCLARSAWIAFARSKKATTCGAEWGGARGVVRVGGCGMRWILKRSGMRWILKRSGRMGKCVVREGGARWDANGGERADATGSVGVERDPAGGFRLAGSRPS